jgi:hypothetical protein
MHKSSSLMLGEEEGVSRNLTGHSSRRHSDGWGQAMRSCSGESEFLHKPKEMWRMDAATDNDAPNAFYREEEGGETVPWRRHNRQRVELFTVFISNRKRKGHCPFWKGKGVCEAALGSRTEGRPEDAMARWCVIAVGGRSRAPFGLTRDGRQQVGPNGCLDRMLLWRSNRLPK